MNLNSRLCSDIDEETRTVFWKVDTVFSLRDMENAAELEPFIKEAESTLKPCAHCGSKAEIVYCYTQAGQRLQDHHVYANCPECRIWTRIVAANDTEEELREALKTVCDIWNRRPK